MCWGWDLSFSRAWAVSGVKHQVVTCFWCLTPTCNLFLAFNARMQHGTGVERQFTSSILEKSMDYYILGESPGCLLSNAIESVPIGILKLQKIHFECREVRIQQHQQSFFSLNKIFCSAPSISARKYLKLQKNTQNHSKVQKYEFFLKTNKNRKKTN